MLRSTVGHVADGSSYVPPTVAAAPDVGAEREATRYLCVAAYRDLAFRRAVLDQIVEHSHKAIAPLYGVDLRTIVAHCDAARRRDRARGMAVLAGAIAGLVVGALLQNAVAADGGGILLAVFVLGGWLPYAAFALDLRYATMSKLTREQFGRHPAPPLPAKLDAAVTRRLQELGGNVVIYSGFNPFVGAGIPAESWSFAVDVTKPRADFGPSKEVGRVDLAELYRDVEGAQRATNIRGLQTRGEVFVSGTDVRMYSGLLAGPDGPPASSMDAAQLSALIDDGTSRLRYYAHTYVQSWDGELTLSLFYRFSRVGQNLFTEASVFILPPSKEDYRYVDRLATRSGVREVATLVVGTIAIAPIAALAAPFNGLAALSASIARAGERKRERRAMRTNPCFDFGAGRSIRELGSSDSYHRYFQRMDREMYGKVLERQLLAAICRYLDERGIDTSELVERQATILNTGIIVTDSSIQGENVVLGRSVKASLKSIGARRKAAATAAPAAH